MTGDRPDDAAADARRRRLKGLGWHLIGYFGTMAVLVPVNFAMTPGNPWFVLPMVGWGSVLALHVAWVMGLFGAVFGGDGDRA